MEVINGINEAVSKIRYIAKVADTEGLSEILNDIAMQLSFLRYGKFLDASEIYAEDETNVQEN